jgi:two-component system, NtrC family, nitrogen regulation sensor histidine kinase NtrY
MHSLRNRLIAAFLIATILPLAATIAITTSLLESSLGYATTEELDGLARTLEDTVRQSYQREREALRQDAAMGRVAPTAYAVADLAEWPDEIRAFWDSAESERFGVSGPEGDRLEYLRRASRGVEVYTRDLAGIHLQELSTKLRQAREVVGSIETRDLRRGFTLTLLLLVAIVWLISLAPLLFMAHRISKPIRQLTAGLTDFAEGDWDRRVESNRGDEVGRAVDAFNHMAEQLRRSRERLVYLTQMSSWQSLARKTAHELKNSLTPIRLTVEEILARQPSHLRTLAPSPEADRAFMQEAAQIVISEIETLERRVRAFSEFAREPPVNPEAFDLNALVTERVSLLKPGHPNTTYRFKLDVRGPRVHAGADLVKGILTNLLENAADAAGTSGSIVTITRLQGDQAVVEVHDSGPGISEEASRTLFEPTITFKKHGMGLGLSIARKNALVLGGDITLVTSELGGAGFRVALPAAQDSPSSRSVRLQPDREIRPDGVRA